MPPDENYLRWLAGFTDGEGAFTVDQPRSPSRKSQQVACQLIVTNTSEAIIREILERTRVGLVTSHRGTSLKTRRVWKWIVRGQEAQGITALLLPFLRLKRSHAELFLQIPQGSRLYPATPTMRMVQRNLAAKLRRLNARGAAALALADEPEEQTTQQQLPM